MLSMIVPSEVQKIILLCLPMISTIRSLRQRSPSSSRCSIVKWMIRSSLGCQISTILPFAMCFLKSIQKLGAVMGLGLFMSVRYMSGRDALAEMESRLCPLGDLIVSRSSSASGCAIFAILPFKSCSFNSWTRLATTIPSKAIKKSFLLVGFV